MPTPNTDQLINDARCIDKCIPDGEKMSVLISVLYQLLQKGTGGGGGGGSGSVTSFSAGNLAPLFTSSVATPTTTPALTFSLSTQTANTLFAGPASGGAVAPTFRAMVTADLGTTLTPQFARVGMGVAADVSIPLYVSGPNNGVGINSFAARIDAPTSDPVLILGAPVANQGMLFAYEKVNNYLFFGVYGAQGMKIDGSGNVDLTGGIYKCLGISGVTGTFNNPTVMTVQGGIVTGVA